MARSAVSSIRRSFRSKRAARVTQRFETLELRALLSTSSINYSDFSSTAGLTANGFGSAAPASNGQLVMTDSQQNEARSVFYNTPVPFDHFTTHFKYQVDSGSQADGLTFALQEDGLSAVGAVGGSLGYQSMGSGNSAAVGVHLYGNQFDVYNGNNEIFNFNGGGAGAGDNEFPFQLNSGGTFDVTISYDGTTLSTTLVDESNSANTFTNSTPIDLASVLGADSAYVGFTAATGSEVSTQRILDWDYSGSGGVTITTPPSTPSPVVTGNTATLSVGATDSTGSGGLTYDWNTTHLPSGAAAPTFDTDAATGNTTVQFHKAGTYVFSATAASARGLTDTSGDVTIVVNQLATGLRITPHSQKVKRRGKQTFTATVTDQFGKPMRTQPAISWTVAKGAGNINASSGLFTAGKSKGHVVLEASDTLDALTGTVGATVV